LYCLYFLLLWKIALYRATLSIVLIYTPIPFVVTIIIIYTPAYERYTTPMIPLTLQIKNFLSYGPELQTINFGPYPLICLSGKNGHGKSALLDAITWSLWGQARKTLGMVK